jgi:hypothetical protein
MESSARLEISIHIQWAIIRGLLSRGIELYGPFHTYEEAVDYHGKNFPDDTAEFIQLRKEVVTHGKR